MIGIVAGRLKEKFGRPAIVVALGEDGLGKGSGRSIGGVDLGAAVMAAKDLGLLVAGGGHAMAAGLTVERGKIEALGEFLDERLAADVARSRDDRALLLDAVLAPGGVCPDLCDALEAGGPYGAGWPAPRVAAGPVRVIKADVVGKRPFAADRRRRRRPPDQGDRLPDGGRDRSAKRCWRRRRTANCGWRAGSRRTNGATGSPPSSTSRTPPGAIDAERRAT